MVRVKEEDGMQVEMLKRRLRGTAVHRFVRAWKAAGRPTPAPAPTPDYDRQTFEVMRQVLRKDSNCIDVGAHKGDILQQMVALAPAGDHHAFEALPHLVPELRERFPWVNVHGLAVGDKNGQAEFLHVENDPQYSGLQRRVYDRPDPRIVPIQVKVVTLDDVIPSDQPIAFIKIDIEGGEYHALKGATKLIRRCQPVIVFEAASKSTGQYGVTAVDLFTLVTQTLGYELSTMGRWLGKQQAYTQQEFCHNWDHGPDYYFIATPKVQSA
jgi:FkbM family methyltransferase